MRRQDASARQAVLPALRNGLLERPLDGRGPNAPIHGFTAGKGGLQMARYGDDNEPRPMAERGPRALELAFRRPRHAASARTNAASSNARARNSVHGSATTMIVARAASMSVAARADGRAVARPGTAIATKDAAECPVARAEAGAAPPVATPAAECRAATARAAMAAWAATWRIAGASAAWPRAATVAAAASDAARTSGGFGPSRGGGEWRSMSSQDRSRMSGQGGQGASRSDREWQQWPRTELGRSEPRPERQLEPR